MPKISTLPRQHSQATAHLEIYKLLVEKRRLQQELETIDQRRHQILERLSVLNGQVTALDTGADPVRESDGQPVSSCPNPFKQPEDHGFETLFLEY